MTRRILLVAAALAALSAGAAAQDASALIERARTLLGEDKQTEAALALESALVALARTMPLTVRTAVLVDEVSAYGSYKQRSSNVFKPSDEMRLYVEPLGFTYAEQNGRYLIDLTGEFAMKLASGQTILSQEELPRFNFDSTRPNREFYLQISYSFEGLRQGEYTILTKLLDRPSGKTVEFQTPIRVVAEGGSTSSSVGTGGQPSNTAPQPQ